MQNFNVIGWAYFKIRVLQIFIKFWTRLKYHQWDRCEPSDFLPSHSGQNQATNGNNQRMQMVPLPTFGVPKYLAHDHNIHLKYYSVINKLSFVHKHMQTNLDEYICLCLCNQLSICWWYTPLGRMFSIPLQSNSSQSNQSHEIIENHWNMESLYNFLPKFWFYSVMHPLEDWCLHKFISNTFAIPYVMIQKLYQLPVEDEQVGNSSMWISESIMS